MREETDREGKNNKKGLTFFYLFPPPMSENSVFGAAGKGTSFLMLGGEGGAMGGERGIELSIAWPGEGGRSRERGSIEEKGEEMFLSSFSSGKSPFLRKSWGW